MSSSVRPRLIASAAAVLLAWSALQLVLVHRGTEWLHGTLERGYRLALGLHEHNPHRFAAPTGPPPTTPMSAWLRPGVDSVVAIILLSLVAATLVMGGRRWGAMLVAVVPAAGVLAGLSNLSPLGYGWAQGGSAFNTWLVVGTLVDTAMLLTVVGLLVLALPAQPASGSARSVVVRVIPAIDILVGWWVFHDRWHDPANRAWLAQAVAFILAAALLAESGLRPVARVVAVAVVLPLCSASVVGDEVIPDGHIGLHEYAGHMVVAVAVAAYAVGVPALSRRYPRLSRPVLAPLTETHRV